VAHRIYRLSISPERAPDVRRVVDFDGRSSLDDVHWTILEVLEVEDTEHLYSFYLSGRYFDQESAYGNGGLGGPLAAKALLFRLGLRAGQSFAYLFDFGDELRHTVTVVSIRDADAPLKEPTLVEAVGEAPPQYPHSDDELDSEDDELDSEDDELEDGSGEPSPALAPLIPVAAALLETYGELTAVRGLPIVLKQATIALELAEALHEDLPLLEQLDAWLEEELLPSLYELPWQLSDRGQTEQALAVSRAFAFIRPELQRGDLALIHARAGQREQALENLAAQLEATPDLAEMQVRAGDVYAALKEPDAGLAHYEQALVATTDATERRDIVECMVELLEAAGREDEAALIAERERERERRWRAETPLSSEPVEAKPQPVARVGRNEPCPCGSGQKYKRCHGAS
jgi:tetratricopeptide (TPR) repeat protein